MSERVKILWTGDGGVATGFARVNESIINNLPEDKYEVHHIAINYRGDPYPDSKALMYPAHLGGDIYGFNRIKPISEKLKPDIIFILNDAWVIAQYFEYLPEDVKVVIYFPVDAKPLDKAWCKSILEHVNIPVAYTEFGRSAILDHFKGADVKVIPHGIDTEKFFPIDQAKARKELEGVTKKDFIVLNANRNQPRKRLDLTIKGFALFCKDKPKNVKLYCHCGVEDIGWHIITFCDRYGITDRLLLTALDLSPGNCVDDERLNWIYNSCDLGLNTAMGEGWGLTTFEHAACKRAQITVDYAASAELYPGIAKLLPIDHYDTYPRILTEGAVTTPEAIAEALEFYYTNSEEREKDAEAIYEFVTQPKFTWKEIGKQWDKIFDEVLK